MEYAHRWAFGRDPEFYDFSQIGGDCTNFASQCLYAGGGVMNFTPDFGWDYISPEDRSPAWAGVPYFWDFMTRTEPSVGPWGMSTTQNFIRPGDFVQLRFTESGDIFAHILVAAHSNDVDNRPLDTYENVEEMRFLHILGIFQEEEE